jgi:hypothetical protein
VVEAICRLTAGGRLKAGDPDGGLLILKFAKDQQEARRVSVYKNKGSGPPEREGWMLAKGETARKGDWRAARVETVANPSGKDQVTSVELVIPTRDAQPAFEGRLDVTWTGPATDTESRAVGQATRQQLTELSPTATTIREGIGSLIDRLKKLQIGGNHVADVRFLFQRGVYDIILTEEDILASPVPG